MSRATLAVACLLVVGVNAGAAPIDPVLADAKDTLADALSRAPDLPPEKEGEDGSTPPEEPPGFDDRVRDGVKEQVAMVSLASGLAALTGLLGFAFVTRYISPKEALKNPQRAMLYGFIRATPGAHLKQLSEEFGMKSSSILWHIRKLESADLVRSDRANGYRVFFPTEGGSELRRVSRAMATLQNRNAHRTLGHLEAHPGATASQAAQSLAIHPGTVRWHLRKLREYGLVEELASDQASRYFPTPLARRTLQTMEGAPVTSPPGPPALGSPVPTSEGR